MSKTVSDNQYRQPLIKKGYIKILLSAFFMLICGLIITSIISFVPRVFIGNPGYQDYQNFARISSGIAKLFIEIGLVLFSISSFLGAISDANLGDNVKRGMMIASGISIFGLIIVFLFPLMYIY